MAISLNKYVDIASTFPSDGFRSRTFGGLLFTASEMLPTVPASTKESYDNGEVLQLTLNDVQAYFGVGSNEYMFANGYYGYVSPTGRLASALSICKVLSSSTPSQYEIGVSYAVSDIVTYSTATYKCTTSVAADDNTSWEAVSSSFTVIPAYAVSTDYSVGTLITKDSVIYSCKTTVEAAENTSWDDVKGSFEAKTFREKAVSAFNRVESSTNMFGSFTFLNTASATFSSDELVMVATRNSGLDTRFLFVVNNKRGTQSATQVIAEKNKYASNEGTVFVSGYTEYSGYMPMAIFASTDYDTGIVTVHMFKQFGSETPTVMGDSEYEAFKTANVNFYGRTQTNGMLLDFYQRGFNTNGTDTAIYCNEVWFKAQCATELITLLTENERVPANDDGVALVQQRVYDVCLDAHINGAFMAKTLSNSSAYRVRVLLNSLGCEVEDIDTIINAIERTGFGIWTYLTSKDNEYIIHYYVFYGTADSIRYIKGDDVLVK